MDYCVFVCLVFFCCCCCYHALQKMIYAVIVVWYKLQMLKNYLYKSDSYYNVTERFEEFVVNYDASEIHV